MPTKIIKESHLRKIFKGKQISEGAIEWLDDYIDQMLTNAYNSVKDNDKVKRINKEIVRFIVNPSSLVVISEDQEAGDDEK